MDSLITRLAVSASAPSLLPAASGRSKTSKKLASAKVASS
jgi:hypothetical protein